MVALTVMEDIWQLVEGFPNAMPNEARYDAIATLFCHFLTRFTWRKKVNQIKKRTVNSNNSISVIDFGRKNFFIQNNWVWEGVFIW